MKIFKKEFLTEIGTQKNFINKSTDERRCLKPSGAQGHFQISYKIKRTSTTTSLLCIVVIVLLLYCCLLLCMVVYCCVLLCIDVNCRELLYIVVYCCALLLYCCYNVVYCCVWLCIVVYRCVLLCIVLLLSKAVTHFCSLVNWYLQCQFLLPRSDFVELCGGWFAQSFSCQTQPLC